MELGRLGTARVAVYTVIEEEFDAARRMLGTTCWVPETPYYVTEPPPPNVVLRRAADRGNVPATEAVRQMIEHWRPEVLMVVGIAGGIAGREDVEPGDVAIGDYIHYFEFRKLTETEDLPRHAAYDQPSVAIRESHVERVRLDGDWRRRIDVKPPKDVDSDVLIKGLVVAEKIMGSPTHLEQRRIVARYSDAIAIDTESFGAARAVHAARAGVTYNIGFLVIRGISDLVKVADPEASEAPSDADQDEVENTEQRMQWKDFAAAAAAAFGAEVVDSLLQVLDPRQELRESQSLNAS